VTFHSLRHIFASSLIERGCSATVVAEQMGHELEDHGEALHPSIPARSIAARNLAPSALSISRGGTFPASGRWRRQSRHHR
jgi:hypothetical protein